MKRYVSGLVLVIALTAAGCSVGPKRAEPLSKEPTAPGDRGAVVDDAAEMTPEARFEEGMAFLRNGQIDAAQRVFEQMSRDFPALSGPPTNLGILHARAERWDAARAALSEAVARNADNKVALNWLAHTYREDRQAERAERYWLQALDVDPRYTAAHINLGMLYEEVMADLPAAVRHYRAAYDSSDESALRVLPWIARLEERLQNAATSSADGTPPSADTAGANTATTP
ncbi:tetratricopeptide repeat protein [Algiphilus sp.]|uniref:tetratricopeptide repeat protein n=1 Tax=Algiphilus sp. TaxID=1872431 RepID=UPI001CA74420|nr:tetratricopeptide repeat protein [Algiphilus sp.]MBY8966787.1 tetratricopeptide repeat protein [Algiphilus acroporae]MCI5104092.1 tetratricopeptide repeat protein [Algiphilus sp.]MCR9091603.1 tetratricopeptide repeat protein [Pseudomonadota bacterium]